MGYGLLCCLWAWRIRTNSRPCCPPMSNPTTSSWIAWPDCSNRWDNRIAPQHLPFDLVWPSSGLKKWLKWWRFNHRSGCGIIAGRRDATCWTVVLKHCSKSRTQLPSTLFGALSSLSITSNVLCNILRYCNETKRVNWLVLKIFYCGSLTKS